MKLSGRVLSVKWKRQVTEAFDELRQIEQTNVLYKKLFNFYYGKKFNYPGPRDDEYETWKGVYEFLQEAHRRRMEAITFPGMKRSYSQAE